MCQTRVDMYRARGSINNELLDLKNPYFYTKIITNLLSIIPHVTTTCQTRVDTCRSRGSITNEFPDLKNPYLHTKIMKIHQDLPELVFPNLDHFIVWVGFSVQLSKVVFV